MVPTKVEIKPQVDKYTLEDEKELLFWQKGVW